MAKPNYQFEKRQRDLAKKRKQEEKRQRKLAARSEAAAGAGNVAAEQPEQTSSSDAGEKTDTASPKPDEP